MRACLTGVCLPTGCGEEWSQVWVAHPLPRREGAPRRAKAASPPQQMTLTHHGEQVLDFLQVSLARVLLIQVLHAILQFHINANDLAHQTESLHCHGKAGSQFFQGLLSITAGLTC